MKSFTRRAFTLIELLVVIAIIAILAAILFPVFTQAKVAAKKTQSLSNVKQLGTSMQIYMSNSDDYLPMSEYGGGSAAAGNYISWATMIYPYVKNGTQAVLTDGTKVINAASGIFRSPSSPIAESVNRSPGEFTYGVHMSMFVSNYGHRLGVDVAPNPAVSSSEIDAPADKIAMFEKGANNPASNWNYPFFHDWQSMWITAICTTPGDPTTVTRDGVEVYTPGTGVYHPMFDNDCPNTFSGGWECAAHPRYRFNQVAPAMFADSHAAAITKRGVKWFKQIWLDRRDRNHFSWYYDYMNGGGWGFPGIH